MYLEKINKNMLFCLCFIFFFFLSIIISLVIAVIIRKKTPEFIDTLFINLELNMWVHLLTIIGIPYLLILTIYTATTGILIGLNSQFYTEIEKQKKGLVCITLCPDRS